MKKPEIKVSAIVPAYNEEKGIKTVLKILHNSDHIHEIICINDGSTDKTIKQIKEIPNIQLINLKTNHGKAYAIAKGLRKATGEIVIFLDADLQGLNDNCIKQLISPLITHSCEVAIGYVASNHMDKFFRPLGGQRAYFRKDLLPYIEKFKKKGYGLELYLNYLFRNKKVKLFPLHGLANILKHEKQSYDVAAKLVLVETFDILAEIVQQKNPVSYLLQSYLFPFYFNKNSKNNSQLSKLINSIRHNINKAFKL